jgi:hypothetical protein
MSQCKGSNRRFGFRSMLKSATIESWLSPNVRAPPKKTVSSILLASF